MSLEEIIEAKVEAGVIKALKRFVHLVPPEYYTVDEVASMMKVHPETVSRMCRNGEITYLKFGKFVRISPADFAKYTEKNKISS